jgi:cytochrome P450
MHSATATMPAAPSDPDAVAPVLTPSPAGPAPDDGRPDHLPEALKLPRALQTLRFSIRQAEFVFRARRQIGETFRFRSAIGELDETIVVTSHPDHIKSLFTAGPDLAPSLTGESPLRPIVGPNSVLTTVGATHMRQRKLLLPSFHGEAIERYAEMITEASDREIDRWPIDEPFALAPRMQAVTLDVIMAGIFGFAGKPEKGTAEYALRAAIRQVVNLSTRPEAQVVELLSIGDAEPKGIVRMLLGRLDRPIYEIIAARRQAADVTERTDILSLLLGATDEEGNGMTDEELRDQLLTLVLAGHETTANQLSWTVERLLRTPDAYDTLRDVTRSGEDATDYVMATIHESMRSRPVIPIIGRRVKVPWDMGEYRLPAETAVLVSILLVHHREDVYPDPFAFRPDRFMGRKPGTYTWLPFGGGTRRCLGAALAMAEQRVVLEAIARRTDMVAPDPRPEKARNRNVTMIPAAGAKVVVRSRRPA